MCLNDDGIGAIFAFDLCLAVLVGAQEMTSLFSGFPLKNPVVMKVILIFAIPGVLVFSSYSFPMKTNQAFSVCLFYLHFHGLWPTMNKSFPLKSLDVLRVILIFVILVVLVVSLLLHLKTKNQAFSSCLF